MYTIVLKDLKAVAAAVFQYYNYRYAKFAQLVMSQKGLPVCSIFNIQLPAKNVKVASIQGKSELQPHVTSRGK